MLRLETPETGGDMMSPAPTTPRGQGTASTSTGPLVLFFFFGRFNFLTKKEVGKKVALKIQSILLYFLFSQAKRWT